MNDNLLLELISKLSSEALAYFFPGYKKEEEYDIDLDIPSPSCMMEADEDTAERCMFSIGSLPEESISDKCFSDEDWDNESPAPLLSKQIFYKEERVSKSETKEIGIVHKSKRMLRGIVGEPDIKDQALDPKTQALLDEIKALQKKYGVTIEEFEAVLSYTVKLSRLRITHHKDIILEDFDRREVKMDTLTKAVFLLYLRHPEGIRYKDLCDHSRELEDIYMSISGRSNMTAMRKSLRDLTDSIMSNSINEKVSKARKAFRDAVDDRVARFYYIDGKQGEAKSIALDRSLVIWE